MKNENASGVARKKKSVCGGGSNLDYQNANPHRPDNHNISDSRLVEVRLSGLARSESTTDAASFVFSLVRVGLTVLKMALTVADQSSSSLVRRHFLAILLPQIQH
jgi:hypothetical protein